MLFGINFGMPSWNFAWNSSGESLSSKVSSLWKDYAPTWLQFSIISKDALEVDVDLTKIFSGKQEAKTFLIEEEADLLQQTRAGDIENYARNQRLIAQFRNWGTKICADQSVIPSEKPESMKEGVESPKASRIWEVWKASTLGKLLFGE